MKAKRVSLASIAKKTGVSKTVVYTVLNKRFGKGIHVSEKTKHKIIDTAEMMGYVAPKSAKELFTGRSDNIGVILHNLISPFSEILTSLHREARKKGLEITPYLTESDEALEEEIINTARDGRVDGLITIASLNGSHERYRKYIGAPYHMKILHYAEEQEGIPTIHFHEFEAGVIAAQHLVEQGCKTFAFLGYRRNPRLEGFLQYLGENGYTKAVKIITDIKKSDDRFAEGLLLSKKLLNSKELPEGVFTSCDMYGVTLIKEALAKGIKIPEDMRIIGCDNSNVCQYITPELTSIDFNIPLLAKKMIQQMKKLINDELTISPHLSVPVKLMRRGSTETI